MALGDPTETMPNVWAPAGPVDQMPNSRPQQNWCAAPPSLVSTDVFAYQVNEVVTSHTEAGQLNPDVVLNGAQASNVLCQYLLIRDFGVGWRHLKTSTLNDALLKAQIRRFETDKTLQLMILGYSDSVGAEQDNAFLRTGRARNVFRLLGPSARSRTAVVKPAPRNEYITVNATPNSRAENRSVIIHILSGASTTT
jgi:outer membrane protein OmpA-like peptidoglycan-associated protein